MLVDSADLAATPLVMDRMMSGSTIGKLQGFLHAMAWVNGKCNHGYTFTFERVASDVDAEASANKVFQGQRIEAEKIVFAPVSHWRREIADVMRRWLLKYSQSSPSNETLIDPTNSFSLSHKIFREEFLEMPLNWFDELVGSTQAWKVAITPTEFYECEWDDYLFFAEDRAYWLHFGVAD